jgi:hypothetical protein
MTRTYTLMLKCVFLLLSISSCEEDDVFNDRVDWTKIEFPDGGLIHAIHGSLDDYMLISTISKILRTTDGGKTGVEVKNVMDPIGEFKLVNDDIYAVSNFKDFISRDKGETWEEVAFDWEITRQPDALFDSKGILYSVVSHYEGELSLPTTFLRSVNRGNSWETIFPNRHLIISSHIDGNDRVYLGVSGSLWNGKFFESDPEFRAYLFYMK